jgi:hypothetical protein
VLEAEDALRARHMGAGSLFSNLQSKGAGVGQVVEHLPSKHESLSLNPSIAKKTYSLSGGGKYSTDS